jgi:hypothetical protein
MLALHHKPPFAQGDKVPVWSQRKETRPLDEVERESLIERHQEEPTCESTHESSEIILTTQQVAPSFYRRCHHTVLFLSICLNAVILVTQIVPSFFIIEAPSTTGYVHQEVVFGLVHIAKTAGTEINGELANHFERVCGNKGYSYDALQTNKRFGESETHDIKYDAHDIVSKEFEGHNRGRVPQQIMNEIGYEDCDYIGYEGKWKFWKKFSTRNMELHVPCRDPVAHLMSQCNYRHRQFNCTARNLEKEVKKCIIGTNRFSFKLMNQPNISLKCFDPIPPDRYIGYMSTKLQRKWIESDYIHRDTNQPRNKTNECIWKEPDIENTVRDIMLKNYDLYRFCNQCMHTDQDLFSA